MTWLHRVLRVLRVLRRVVRTVRRVVRRVVPEQVFDPERFSLSGIKMEAKIYIFFYSKSLKMI
jgi:hypothetical protein